MRLPLPILTTPDDIRQRFARGRCIELVLARGYDCCIKCRRDRTLSTEPEGVESITLKFFDPSGTTIFVVHCYLHANGDFGTSGLFDPKYLLDVDGQGYYVP